MAKAKTVRGPMIDPKQWRIIGPFTHQRISYAQGEPVPKMTLSDAQVLMANGHITPLNEDATGNLEHGFKVVLGREPERGEDYLKGTDFIVFRRIRAFKPDPAMLRSIEQAANRQGRSLMLLEVLRAMLGDPL